MKRRNFLESILALGAAPAIVRADSLMRVVPRETGIILASWTTITPGPALVVTANPAGGGSPFLDLVRDKYYAVLTQDMLRGDWRAADATLGRIMVLARAERVDVRHTPAR